MRARASIFLCGGIGLLLLSAGEVAAQSPLPGQDRRSQPRSKKALPAKDSRVEAEEPDPGTRQGLPPPISTDPREDARQTDALAPTDAQASAAAKKPPAWAPKLSATVSPAVVHLGDPITMTIKVRHRQGVSANLPVKLELGVFSELSREEETREVGAKGEIPTTERIFTLKLAAYALGEHTLPAVEVTALGPNGELITVPTTAIPIQVKSLMANEPTPKLKALEPPVLVFQRTWWFLYLVIALVGTSIIVLATLLTSRYLRRRRERQKPPPPPVPAHVIALARLAQVQVEQLIAEEKYKELFLLLSEILRDYVGRRFDFDALEMTTTEINDMLQLRGVSSEVRTRLELFFNDCDLVKFAKYRPTPEGAQKIFSEAETLVRETAQVQKRMTDLPATGNPSAPQAPSDHQRAASDSTVTNDSSPGHGSSLKNDQTAPDRRAESIKGTSALPDEADKEENHGR